MKKLPALLLALVMVLSVTACASNNTSATTGAPKAADTTAAENKVDDSAFDGEIVFGLSTAVTGNFPLAGERTLQGVDLAVEEINAAGGVLGKKLTYIYEDDGNDATTAVNVVTKLLNEDVVAVLSLPFALLTEQIRFQDILSAAMPLAYAGILSMGVAYSLQIVGQRRVPPTAAALLMSLESVFAALFGWLLLHETMTGSELFGCALVFCAVILSQLPERKASKSPAL